MLFPVVMYGCENWTVKKAEHWRIDAFELVLEKTLESPLDFKEIQSVHSKGDQSWVFIGRTDAEAETPILWPPHAKSWLIGKDSDARRDWEQEEKGTTEDEMAGWHHQLDGDEFEWTPAVGDGQGGLVCCGSWSRKELDMTEQLNWTELNIVRYTTCVIKSASVQVTTGILHHPSQAGQGPENPAVFPLLCQWHPLWKEETQKQSLIIFPHILWYLCLSVEIISISWKKNMTLLWQVWLYLSYNTKYYYFCSYIISISYKVIKTLVSQGRHTKVS